MIHKKWNKIVAVLIANKSAQIIYDNSLYEYLVVAEDHRFWWHLGFDIISLARATWRSKINKKREGGSTIAMQLVRTISQDYRPSIKRKLSEIYLEAV
jgi:membrane carboxypeptidase/penicillin-binding protein PbpC